MSSQKPQRVSPPQRGYWDEHGWSKEQREDGTVVYRGRYRIKKIKENLYLEDDGSLSEHIYGEEILFFNGRIIVKDARIETFICDPPYQALKWHPNNLCFNRITQNPKPGQPLWYKLNWNRDHRPTDIDTAILAFEHVLYEAITRYNKW